MTLIYFEISFILTRSENFVIFSETGGLKFAITDTKLYVLIVTLPTQDNAKLFEQLKSGSKRATNWNKYKSKVSIEKPNENLDSLIDPTFQGVNRLFVLSFKNNTHRTRHAWYFLYKVEINNYDVMADGQNFFN